MWMPFIESPTSFNKLGLDRQKLQCKIISSMHIKDDQEEFWRVTECLWWPQDSCQNLHNLISKKAWNWRWDGELQWTTRRAQPKSPNDPMHLLSIKLLEFNPTTPKNQIKACTKKPIVPITSRYSDFSWFYQIWPFDDFLPSRMVSPTPSSEKSHHLEPLRVTYNSSL